jgi:hypothetical protein
MRYISFVETAPAETVEGDPVLDKSGVAQHQFTHLDLLLSLLTLPQFAEEPLLQGVELAEIIYNTRQALRDQAEAAAKHGYWVLEDDPAKRMKRAAERGPIRQDLAHCLYPFLRAVRDQTAVRPPPERAEG